MAEQQQNISAPFPTPPPFYQHFTKANLTRLRQLQRETRSSQQANERNGESTKDLDILSLPPELRYLIPPAPPAEDKYRSFGVELDLHAPDATLEEAGIEQLYPTDPSVKLNPQPHLIALSRSLLTTFLSLVGILSQNPVDLYGERVESLQTIMYNIHDLINQYRPHHARENLVLMMEERVERTRDEIRRIQEAKGRFGEVMRGLKEGGEVQARLQADTAAGGDGGLPGSSFQDDERRSSRQKAAWTAMEEEIQRPS